MLEFVNKAVNPHDWGLSTESHIEQILPSTMTVQATGMLPGIDNLGIYGGHFFFFFL